jgi:hypothetical protein
MSMNRSRCARRTFLTGFGASLAAAPFIPLPAHAELTDYPKRIIFFVTPNGTVMDSFWPNEGFDLAASPILAPLAELKDRIIVMRNVDNAAAEIDPIPKDHWPDNCTLLTGRQGIIRADQTCDVGGMSIDQHIGDVVSEGARFHSLHLGALAYYTGSLISARAAYEPISPQNDAGAAFDTIFADVMLDPFGLAQLRARRGSVLDTVSSELRALECELTGSHREKLQRHLDAIQKLELSLAGTAAENCTIPTLADLDSGEPSLYDQTVQQHLTIMTHALQCNLTRVGTMLLYGNKIGHPWLGIDGSHHGIAHGSEGVDADEATRRGWLIDIDHWYAERLRDFMMMLDAVQEGDGTLLDHTAIVWLHEQSNAATHQRSDMPVVIAGGLKGAFTGGRRIDAGGVAHNGLLISLAEAMDVPTPEFGDPGLTNGPIADLYG